jgi:pimeloyl-ACP methyl ester carboxylesterase
MPKVKVGDINMYYEVHGQGKPLVLIMGYMFNCAGWFPILPGLSQKYQVIVFDNRGAGQSDKPDLPYTIKMMAEDTAGLIDAIGIKTANIFGFSMGGMIAQQFAIRYPERVTSLILGSSGCGGTHEVARDTVVNTILFDFERAKKMAPQDRIKELFSVFYSQEYIQNNPVVIQVLAKQMIEHPTDPLGTSRQAQAIIWHDTYEQLPKIMAPTLIIQGDVDRVIPVANAQILASKIPHAQTTILNGKGHVFYLEAPAETNQAVMNFLGKH